VASHSGFHLHSPDESQAKHLVMHVWPFVCHRLYVIDEEMFVYVLCPFFSAVELYEFFVNFINL
jgi:hypothetical protein